MATTPSVQQEAGALPDKGLGQQEALVSTPLLSSPRRLHPPTHSTSRFYFCLYTVRSLFIYSSCLRLPKTCQVQPSALTPSSCPPRRKVRATEPPLVFRSSVVGEKDDTPLPRASLPPALKAPRLARLPHPGRSTSGPSRPVPPGLRPRRRPDPALLPLSACQ